MPENEGDWVEGYEKAFWRFFVKKGGIEENRVTEFGWKDDKRTQKFKQHMRSCRVDRTKTKMPTGSTWWKFTGTFTDNEYVDMLDATITCVCSKYRKTKVRYEGKLSDVVLGVLGEAGKEAE